MLWIAHVTLHDPSTLKWALEGKAPIPPQQCQSSSISFGGYEQVGMTYMPSRVPVREIGCASSQEAPPRNVGAQKFAQPEARLSSIAASVLARTGTYQEIPEAKGEK